VAVRSPVTARLSFDTGGWGTTGNPWNLVVNGKPSGVIEYSGESGEPRILNVSLDNRLVTGPNKVELIGAVWPNSRGGLLLLSGSSIVINADYTWSGSSMHNPIHQTWTIDFQPAANKK
jgi:hypothetical protein